MYDVYRYRTVPDVPTDDHIAFDRNLRKDDLFDDNAKATEKGSYPGEMPVGTVNCRNCT